MATPALIAYRTALAQALSLRDMSPSKGQQAFARDTGNAADEAVHRAIAAMKRRRWDTQQL